MAGTFTSPLLLGWLCCSRENILKALLRVSYLEKSFASVQKDFVEKFYVLLFHEFVGVDPGALVQPQVNQVHWVTDTLRQGKQDSLHAEIHGRKYRVV